MELLDGSTDFDRLDRAAPTWWWNPVRRIWSGSRSCSRAWTPWRGPDAVLASNTSGLSITAIAARCTRPERVVTTHFWNPPHLMPLVEIVQGEKTSARRRA